MGWEGAYARVIVLYGIVLAPPPIALRVSVSMAGWARAGRSRSAEPLKVLHIPVSRFVQSLSLSLQTCSLSWHRHITLNS